MKYLPFIGGAAIALGLWTRPVAHQRSVTVTGDSTYTLRGKITGLDSGWVFLYHPEDGPTDSTTISQGQFQAEDLRSIYNGLTPALRDSREGRLLKNTLDATMLTGIGQPAPAFTQTNTEGKPVSLSSFKGQYVLIDFWASWCGPCRVENPNVLKNYQRYHAKGFTILGVSLDSKKDQWTTAIDEDGLPWTQVSDLKGWKNEVAVQYGVEGIPMNFLLDRNGTIVAKGLRGPDLEKQLAALVH
jgi:peroxiredoxin